VSERETEGGEREGETMNREPHQSNNKLERSYDEKEGGESFSPGSHLKAPLRLIMCSLLESCGAASSPSSFSSDKRETFCVVKRIIEIPRVISTEINISEQERGAVGHEESRSSRQPNWEDRRSVDRRWFVLVLHLYLQGARGGLEGRENTTEAEGGVQACEALLIPPNLTTTVRCVY
jgi:hypothetical protein